MTYSDIYEAIGVGFGLSFLIGPVFFMLIQTSITKGVRAAISFNIGVVLADILFILIAYYSSRSLLESIKDDPRLFYFGGSILIIYGILTFFSKKDTAKDTAVTKNNYILIGVKGFLVNFINIGVLAFWLGIIMVVGPAFNMVEIKIFNYFAIVLSMYFITDVFKILLAKQLLRKLTPKRLHLIKKTMGIILVIFGMFIFAKPLLLHGFWPE